MENVFDEKTLKYWHHKIDGTNWRYFRDIELRYRMLMDVECSRERKNTVTMEDRALISQSEAHEFLSVNV